MNIQIANLGDDKLNKDEQIKVNDTKCTKKGHQKAVKSKSNSDQKESLKFVRLLSNIHIYLYLYIHSTLDIPNIELLPFFIYRPKMHILRWAIYKW